MKDICEAELRKALQMIGYEKVEDKIVERIALVQNMGENEKLIQIKNLTEYDMGRTIAINLDGEDINGVLEDIHITSDKCFLAIGGKIQPLDPWTWAVIDNDPDFTPGVKQEFEPIAVSDTHTRH